MPTVCVEMLHFVGDFDADRRADALRQMTLTAQRDGRYRRAACHDAASYGMFSTRLPPFVSPRSEPRITRCWSMLSASWPSTPSAKAW